MNKECREPGRLMGVLLLIVLAMGLYGCQMGAQETESSALNKRGTEYAAKGDYDRAIADHTEAIRLQPDDAKAYYNRGVAYKSKGEKAKAIADFERYLQLSTDPNLRAKAEQYLRELRGS